LTERLTNVKGGVLSPPPAKSGQNAKTKYGKAFVTKANKEGEVTDKSFQ